MTPAPLSAFRLRSLPGLVRLGLTALLLTILLGMAASASHLFDHYKNRDEQKDFTLDDLRAPAIVLCALLYAPRLPRTLIPLLIALNGLSLFADLISWWLTRTHESFVYLIAAAGAAFNASPVLIALLILADLWLPRRAAA